MDLDIEAENVAMQPAWYREIQSWVARCVRHYPTVAAVELTLRHDENRSGPNEVCAAATSRNHRRVSTRARASLMHDALHEALETLEHEILLHEPLPTRAAHPA